MPGHGDALARDFRGAVAARQLDLDRTHGGDVDAWAHRVGVEAGAIVDFSASINPLGPPPSARNAFVKSYDDISCYPDPYGAILKIALAERHGLSPTEVLLGNGSTQLIYLLCAALRPRRALIVGPAFSEYANALTLGGAEAHALPLRAEDGFRLSTERLVASWGKSCDIVFFTTPNSVTGQIIPLAEMDGIARAALARKSFICVDEAFIDFVEEQSVKRLVRGNPYLIVLRSLTKYYALPGLRLGYLLGEARRVTQIADYAEPWSVNAPALNVALACLKDKHFVVKTRRWLATERSFLSRKLAALPGLHPFPSQANFLLVKVTRKRLDALQLRSFLAQKGILIRVCDSFAGLGSEYFRIAVKRRADNLRLLAALKEVIGDNKPIAT